MKHYTRQNFHLRRSVGFAISKSRNVLTTEMDSALQELDISTQQMGILLSLMEGEAATPFELSKLLGIDSGLMTRMLDKLEARGLLRRSRNLEDRRMVNLELTKTGEQLAARIPDIAPQVLNARLKNFTQAEFAELGRLLAKLLED